MYCFSKYVSAALVFIFTFACQEARSPDTIQTGMENKELPSFHILLPDSVTYFNTSSYETGKNIVLFYYKPSCPYCRMQMRDIIKNMKILEDFQLCIVTYPDFSGMKEFTTEFSLSKYSNIVTGIDTGYTILKNYRIPAMPFTAIFDRRKRLKSAYLGPLTSGFLSKESKL